MSGFVQSLAGSPPQIRHLLGRAGYVVDEL